MKSKATFEELEAAYRRHNERMETVLADRRLAEVRFEAGAAAPRERLVRRVRFGSWLRSSSLGAAAAVVLVLLMPPMDGRAMSPGADRTASLGKINTMLAAL